jgi:hypothetical protein
MKDETEEYLELSLDDYLIRLIKALGEIKKPLFHSNFLILTPWKIMISSLGGMKKLKIFTVNFIFLGCFWFMANQALVNHL